MGFLFFEKNKMLCMLAGSFCLLMMVFPEITVGASKEAICIWMNAVVPSLLPFMIIADYIKRTGIGSLSDSVFYPVLMAVLSGYPMGAKLAGDRYRDGLTDEQGLYRLLCYAMITGPAFLIGGVGVTFYQSRLAGYILTVSHYGGIFSCGILLGGGGVHETKTNGKTRLQQGQISDTPFTDCILQSFRTLGIVLAYIILFMIAADFVDSTGLLEGLPEAGRTFCKGLLEMTVGCSEIAACGAGLKMKLVLSSFVISFGGLSVMGQTMSMLADCPVTLWQILKIKVIHGLCSAIWTFIICAFMV